MTQTVLIRFYAAAKDAAGKDEIQVLPGSLEEILLAISKENSRLTHVLIRCSFLIDGALCQNQSTVLLAGSTLDVLPPFAGG